jgi:hypothetical protein
MSPKMPMTTGMQWTYQVRGPFSTYVEPMTVRERRSVAGVPGFVLSSGLGESRLAWKASQLLAESVHSTRFEPPIPLLDLDRLTLNWSGTMTLLNSKFQAKAEVVQSNERLEIGGRKMNATVSTILIELPKRRIELKTWFVDRIGIARQTQHTNGRQDVSIDWIAGP